MHSVRAYKMMSGVLDRRLKFYITIGFYIVRLCMLFD